MRGSLSSGITSDSTWRTDSSTRRIREAVPSLRIRVDEQPVGGADLPLLAAQPALRLVEQALGLVGLARDAGDREAGALPEVVVVDLRDRGADPVAEVVLRRADEVPLLLERARPGEVELDRQHADESGRHRGSEARCDAAPGRRYDSAPLS